jgi:hypothetical protein
MKKNCRNFYGNEVNGSKKKMCVKITHKIKLFKMSDQKQPN